MDEELGADIIHTEIYVMRINYSRVRVAHIYAACVCKIIGGVPDVRMFP